MADVKIPGLGESVVEATIAKWSKTDGATVAPDDVLAELETDKAAVELNSPERGVLRILKQAGQTVAVGEVVARIEASDTIAQATTPKADDKGGSGNGAAVATGTNPAASGSKLSPAVERVVAENKLDPSQIAATGPKGNITKADALAATQAANQAATAAGPSVTAKTAADGNALLSTMQSQGGTAKAFATSAGTTAAPVAVPSKTLQPSPAAPDFGPDQEETRQPMSKLRQTIARRLVEAQHTAAALTTFNEVDMSAVMALREKYKEKFEKQNNIGLGFMSFFAKAVIHGIRAVPAVNASIDGNEFVYRKNVHLGIAVSTERGLIVPVVRYANKLSMAQIESEIKRLATKAREGKITVDELGGGTFTITNGGVFGSLVSTPILNPPQSGILGMHKIEKRPVVITEGGVDKIEIRAMMYVALTYDHRVIDGQQSVTFLVKVKEALEDPARLVLEV